MKQKLLIALCYLLLGQTIKAQTDSSVSFTLQQAVEFALKNQSNVKNALIDQELAEKKVNEITGIGLPQINSSFDVRDFIDVPTSLIPAEAFGGPPGVFTPARFGTKYQASGGLDASQLVFSGEYLLGLKASKVYVDLATKAMQRTKIETAVAVSKAYYAALINQQRLKLMDANLERVKTAMGGAQGLYAYGFAEKLDYDRLVVTHNNLLVEKEKIERLVALSSLLLKYQMGMNVNTPIALTDKLEDVALEITKDVSAEQFDYSKRVEYNLFETQRKLASLDLKKNRVAFLPTAAAYASFTRNGFSRNNRGEFDLFKNGNTWYPTSIIGAKFTMSIFTGFQRNAKTQQAKLSLQKAENNIESLKKSIDFEVASSATMLQNASVSLENQKKNIALAEDIYKASKLKFEQGVGTNLEMVTAETTLVEAQTNYFNALYDAIVTKIDFDKASGNIKY